MTAKELFERRKPCQRVKNKSACPPLLFLVATRGAATLGWILSSLSILSCLFQNTNPVKEEEEVEVEGAMLGVRNILKKLSSIRSLLNFLTDIESPLISEKSQNN